jgi:hypothetical protein
MYIPSTVNAVPDAPLAQSSAITPLRDCQPFPVKRQKMIVPPVVRLFLYRCPPAVIPAVVTIGINAVKRSASRTITHITEKRFKGSKPFRANNNSSATIKRVAHILRIITPGFHPAPRLMFPVKVRAAKRMAFGLCRSFALLFSKATTRLGAAFFQFACGHGFTTATRTPAMPGRTTVYVFGP